MENLGLFIVIGVVILIVVFVIGIYNGLVSRRNRVDEALEEYRRRHDIDEPWETRERILVALTGSADGDRLVRRGLIIGRRHTAVVVATSDEQQRRRDERDENFPQHARHPNSRADG